MAAGFEDDPFFSYLLPDKTNRLEALTLLLKNYVDMLYDYGSLFASSKRMEALAFVYRPHQIKEPATFPEQLKYQLQVWLAIAKSTPLCRQIGVKQFVRLFQTSQTMNSEWVQHFVHDDCAHLEFLVVQEQYRGHGLARKLLGRILSSCRSKSLTCSLETHNPRNIGMYEHFDFELVERIRMPDSDLVQYCMLYNP